MFWETERDRKGSSGEEQNLYAYKERCGWSRTKTVYRMEQKLRRFNHTAEVETQGPVNLKAEYRNDHREKERKGTHDHGSSQGLVHKHLNTLSFIYFLNKITFGEESMIYVMQVQAG